MGRDALLHNFEDLSDDFATLEFQHVGSPLDHVEIDLAQLFQTACVDVVRILQLLQHVDRHE